jgi:hypothetical protein
MHRPTTLIDKIFHDLENAVITARTSRAELSNRYGHMVHGGDPWREYKIALRAYALDNGCLVLIDDDRSLHVATMKPAGPDITSTEAAAYFQPFVDNHLRLFPRKPTRLSIFRLPVGDYSGEGSSFFEERGEYLWETRVKK